MGICRCRTVAWCGSAAKIGVRFRHENLGQYEYFFTWKKLKSVTEPFVFVIPNIDEFLFDFNRVHYVGAIQSPMRWLTICSLYISTLSPGLNVASADDPNLCFSARLRRSFAMCTFISFWAVFTTSDLAASEGRGFRVPIFAKTGGNYPITSADVTNPSGLRVLFISFTAKASWSLLSSAR